MEYLCPYREANTIFRGNSLATRCIDDMMKIVGKNYLSVTLKPVIDEVWVKRRHTHTHILCRCQNSHESLGLEWKNPLKHLPFSLSLQMCRCNWRVWIGAGYFPLNGFKTVIFFNPVWLVDTSLDVQVEGHCNYHSFLQLYLQSVHYCVFGLFFYLWLTIAS